MRQIKSTVFWIIYSTVSYAALIVAFPTLLFYFYPYGIITVALYAVIALSLSFLCFVKKTQWEWIKKILFLWMLIPIVTIVVILFMIGMGIIHFPG
jgi:hypothetical protein